jgi:hypothetical protein
MTSNRQIEANRRNALRSTGPRTEAGKLQSRRNAIRHGLTAETVIGSLENAEDYSAFEAAIIADYDAQSSVERELALRLASILWRLRRATAMETGLFEIHAERSSHNLGAHQLLSCSQEVTRKAESSCCSVNEAERNRMYQPAAVAVSKITAEHETVEFARCFLRLANLPNFALDRLSRYEATLCRQASRILFALHALDRQKPQERRRRLFGMAQEFLR